MKQYLFFYKSKHPFSNWYKSSFVCNNITFNCSEQYMMYEKAMMFNDVEVAQLILETDDPYKQKFLGREVRGFIKEKWNADCKEIMVPGLVAKFTQNEYLKQFILGTNNLILVEASPSDKIWGIGLSEDDPRALDETQWLGTNWLGDVLMQTRDIIRGLDINEKL
jgi:ribA/ribD-fused uncharacterized protein